MPPPQQHVPPSPRILIFAVEPPATFFSTLEAFRDLQSTFNSTSSLLTKTVSTVKGTPEASEGFWNAEEPQQGALPAPEWLQRAGRGGSGTVVGGSGATAGAAVLPQQGLQA